MNYPSLQGRNLRNHMSYVNVMFVYFYKNCFSFEYLYLTFCPKSYIYEIYFRSCMYGNVRKGNANISLFTAELLGNKNEMILKELFDKRVHLYFIRFYFNFFDDIIEEKYYYYLFMISNIKKQNYEYISEQVITYCWVLFILEWYSLTNIDYG